MPHPNTTPPERREEALDLHERSTQDGGASPGAREVASFQRLAEAVREHERNTRSVVPSIHRIPPFGEGGVTEYVRHHADDLQLYEVLESLTGERLVPPPKHRPGDVVAVDCPNCGGTGRVKRSRLFRTLVDCGACNGRGWYRSPKSQADGSTERPRSCKTP